MKRAFYRLCVFLLCSPVLLSLNARAQSTFATLPFTDGFESGVVQSYWLASGTGSYRGQITTANSPHSGSRHYTMDSYLISGTTYSRNQLTLGLNLAGYTNVVLTFWVKSFGDELHGPPPTPFDNGWDFDGVAISQDGVRWYEVQGLRILSSSYVLYTVNLDVPVAAFGLAYNSTFRIRFNQYDNLAISGGDGIGFDDIAVTGNRIGILHHFNLSSVSSPQLVNAPFPLTIAAVDGANNVIAGFNGTAGLWGVTSGNVPVNPGVVGPFVNGSWSGSISVTQTGALVRLHGDDGAGHVGDGNNFTVLATNDIALNASASLDPVPLGTNLVYVLNVLNAGPGTATGVIVTNTLPANVSFVAANLSQGNSTLNGRTFVWNAGSLAGRTNALASLVVTPTAAGALTNAAIVSRTGADADSANNTVQLITQAAAMGILTVSPATGLASTGITGGPFTPSNQVYTVSNSGSATLSWGTIRIAPWLTRSPASGSLGPGDSVDVSVRLNTTANTLAPGNYLDTLLLTNTSTGLGSTTRLINLVVNSNHPPVATGQTVQTVEDMPVTVTLLGSDTDGDPLTASITLLPVGGGRLFQTTNGTALGAPIGSLPAVVSNAQRQVIYVPPKNAAGTSIDGFLFRMNDGRTNSSAAAVMIDVTAVNDSPEAVPDTVNTLPSTTTAPFNVLANDFDAEGNPFSLSSYTRPSLGTLMPVGGGTFTYTPNASVVKGIDQFTYTISDGSGHLSSATVTIHIGYLVAGDWPTLGNGPQHTGYYPSSLGSHAFTALWTNTFGGAVNQAAVGGGKIFVTTTEFVLAALDPRTGRQLWRDKFAFGNSMNPPTYDSGRVYFQRSNHETDTQLRCVDASAGAVLWSASHGAQWDWYYAPLVVGDGVWVNGGTYGGMYGFDTSNGGMRFFDAWNDMYQAWTPTYYGNVVYAWSGGVFRACDPVTGGVIWSNNLPWSDTYGDMNTVPAALNNRAFVTAGTYLYALDLASHSIAWTVPASWFRGTPAVANDVVYCIYSSGLASEVRAYNFADGSPLGSYVATNDTGLSGQPIVLDDVLLAASGSATYVFDLQTHELRQTLPVGGTLSLANGTLYIVNGTALRAYTLDGPPPANDVSISISLLPSNVLVLQPLTYTITITNPGSEAATGVNVTNTLTPGATVLSAVPSQGTCTTNGGIIAANLGTMAAGASATVTVTIVPNTGGNLVSFARMTRSAPDPDTFNNEAQAGTAVYPPVSISDVSLLEGNVGTTNVVFNISIPVVSSQAFSVNYSTSDGTATGAIDYVARSGTITFPAGTTNQTLAITAKGDTVIEPNEVFFVTLTNPTLATLAKAQGQATIGNDDGLPGQIHHFTWSPIASPQYRGEPFAAVLTARDAANNVVTGFNGPVPVALRLGGLNFDFENALLDPWRPLNVGSSPGPYELAQFDVRGDGNTSQAFRLKPDSGGDDGVAQTLALNGGVTYTFDVDIAIGNETGSVNGGIDWALLYVSAAQIDDANFGDIGIGETQRGPLHGTYTPPASGNYDLKVSFRRGFTQVAIWCYVDNQAVKLPSSSTNYTPLTVTLTNGVWSGVVTALQPGPAYCLSVDDGFGHGGASAAFAVLTNHVPVANSMSLLTAEDTPLPLVLAGSDPDSDLLGYGVAGSPTNGTLTGTAPSLTYSPNSNFWGGDGFAFFVNDGKGNSATGQVAITVVSVADLGYSQLALQRPPSQAMQLSLQGEPFEHYAIEASEDLVHWTIITNLIATNGVLGFIDPDAALYQKRFYRAALHFDLPQLSALPWITGAPFQLNLGVDVGRNYEIWTSTNLVDWVPLTTMTATNPLMLFVDPAASGYRSRFYRARIVP